MHICPDEIVPVMIVLRFFPFCCRWVWYKAKWLCNKLGCSECTTHQALPEARIVKDV